jgi:hypothetical protein
MSPGMFHLSRLYLYFVEHGPKFYWLRMSSVLWLLHLVVVAILIFLENPSLVVALVCHERMRLDTDIVLRKPFSLLLLRTEGSCYLFSSV